MSTADYKSFWLAQQIKGGSTPPEVKKTPDDMLSFIKGNASSIGYVPAGTAADGVKVIKVE